MVGLRRRKVLLAGLGCLCGGCIVRGYRSALNTPGIHYRVQPGDTLAAIARDHGVSVVAIVRANHLGNREPAPGHLLFLPGARAPLRHHQPAEPQGDYALVRRTDWGALRPGGNHDPMNGIGALTLHHTCEYDGMARHSDLQAVQTIASIHRDRLGWADIGYHYLIGRDGRVYEGRPLALQGAHCGGPNNRHNLGVALIGDFSRRQPAGTQARTARALLRDLLRHHRIGQRHVYAHREFNGQYTATECPGDGGFAWLERFRRS